MIWKKQIATSAEGAGSMAICEKCKGWLSDQEARAGFKICEHCSGDCGCGAVLAAIKKQKENEIGDVEDLTDSKLKEQFFILKREMQVRKFKTEVFD